MVGDVITLSNGGGTVTLPAASAPDSDPDPSNELNTALSLDGNNNVLTVTDGGGPLTADLTPLVNDADADPEDEEDTDIDEENEADVEGELDADGELEEEPSVL